MNAEWWGLQGDSVNTYAAYKQWSFHTENAYLTVPNPRDEFCLETIWEEKAKS